MLRTGIDNLNFENFEKKSAHSTLLKMLILHSKTQINDHLRVCNIPKKFRIKKLIPNIYNFLRIHPSTSKQYFTPLSNN